MDFYGAVKTAVQSKKRYLFGVILAMIGSNSHAQVAPAPVPPALGSSCTVSALNRNAPLAPNLSFTIFNIPGTAGPFRVRATCSDGTIGQTAVAFPTTDTTVLIARFV